MKTIGLLGGMSWESTQPYYRLINEAVRAERGGLHSARILLHSFDFAEVAALQNSGDWAGAGRLMTAAASGLRAAGAECIAICTNTMHKLAPAVEHGCGLPLLHIADAAGEAIQARGLQRVGLLGTRFTMEDSFYHHHLREHFGLSVLTPDEADRQEVHRVIYEELCQGEVRESSRHRFLAIIDRLATQGAQGVVLGCTEIPMLITQRDCALPLFDTATLHARYIADWALA